MLGLFQNQNQISWKQIIYYTENVTKEIYFLEKSNYQNQDKWNSYNTGIVGWSHFWIY